MADSKIICPRLGSITTQVEIVEDELNIKRVRVSTWKDGNCLSQQHYSIKHAMALANLLNKLELPKER